MKFIKFLILVFSLNIVFSASVEAQINLKKAKNLIKTKTAKTVKNPCDNNGTVKITENSKAYTMYKSVTKQIELAENYNSKGLAKSANKNISNAEKYLGYLLKKEPNADISELCNRIKSLKNESSNTANRSASFLEVSYFLNQYYRRLGTSPKPEQFGFLLGDFKEKAKNFNRKKILDKVSKSNNDKAIEIKNILSDYSAFIDREGIVEFLMNKLDEDTNKPAVQLSKKAQNVKEIAIGLQNISGDNSDIKRLIAFADKQLAKADSKSVGIYTSDFHKKNVNKVVFTKKRFKPGNESSVEINPTFISGDAIYGTIYLSASIKDAIDSWKGYGKGGTMALEVENSNGDFLNRKFESWEVSSYSNYEVSIAENVNKELSYVQFVVIPNLETDLSIETSCKNITPILMVRGLSLESERLKKYTVEIKSSGQKTGFVKYKGTFKIDLASGEGPSYYAKAESVAMDKLLEANPLPKAKINNTSLEAQLLSEMKKQGFQEQFKKAYIQTDWKLFKPFNKEQYREMKASFTYATSDGKCGWQTYSFRSFKTCSGWSSPQKWGGADQRQRVSCNKLK